MKEQKLDKFTAHGTAFPRARSNHTEQVPPPLLVGTVLKSLCGESTQHSRSSLAPGSTVHTVMRCLTPTSFAGAGSDLKAMIAYGF